MNLTYAQVLIIVASFLPAVAAGVGSTLAGTLRQDGFPPVLNSAISFVAVVAFASLDVLATGKMTNNLTSDYASIQSAVTILLAGSLHTLTPYVDTLQSNILAYLPAKTQAPSKGLNTTAAQTLQSVQNIEQALIPGVTPNVATKSTNATPTTWKPTIAGPTTPDHAG